MPDHRSRWRGGAAAGHAVVIALAASSAPQLATSSDQITQTSGRIIAANTIPVLQSAFDDGGSLRWIARQNLAGSLSEFYGTGTAHAPQSKNERTMWPNQLQKRTWKIAGGLLLFALAVCGLLFISGGPYMLAPEAARQQLIQQASSKVPCVAQFRSLYPNARIGVFSRQFRKGTTVVQLDEIAHDRYLLEMSVNVEVNKLTLHITSSATPLIKLVEITNVSGSPNGPLKCDCGTNFTISPSQWSRIVESRGDFRSASIAVKTDEPATGIALLKAYRTGKDF